MRRLLGVLSLLLLLSACGDDGEGSVDASSSGTIDSGSVADAPQGGPDAMPGTPDAAAVDYGPVDCRSTADCMSPATCNLTAPGGICNGCGAPDSCGVDYTCMVGACVRDCNDDTECSAGKRCAPGSGRCLLRSCNNGTPCPTPYACNGGFCRRPACGANNSCEGGFVCDVGEQICMEP